MSVIDGSVDFEILLLEILRFFLWLIIVVDLLLLLLFSLLCLLLFLLATLLLYGFLELELDWDLIEFLEVTRYGDFDN